MYKRILVALDATSTEENRSAMRHTEQIGRLTGGTIYVLQVREHFVPGDITAGAAFGSVPVAEDFEEQNGKEDLIDRPGDAGADAHEEMISTTDDVARVILQHAENFDVDLLVLGYQHRRGADGPFRSSVAECIIHHDPPFSILLTKAKQAERDEAL